MEKRNDEPIYAVQSRHKTDGPNAERDVVRINCRNRQLLEVNASEQKDENGLRRFERQSI